MEFIALLCILAALGLLLLLSYIDLKTFLLPNIYVAPFALLAIAFHIFLGFNYLTFQAMLIGGAAGYAFPWLIRAAGNKYYGQESLGLGDVKLLGAGGLWLGLEGIIYATTLGAIAGLVHGLIYASYLTLIKKKPFNIRRLTIPAGPGFAIGIIMVGGWLYKGLILSTIYSLFS
jgi:leader peptidase (prepilin peptidase)/N-methyltransferase